MCGKKNKFTNRAFGLFECNPGVFFTLGAIYSGRWEHSNHTWWDSKNSRCESDANKKGIQLKPVELLEVKKQCHVFWVAGARQAWTEVRDVALQKYIVFWKYYKRK